MHRKETAQVLTHATHEACSPMCYALLLILVSQKNANCSADQQSMSLQWCPIKRPGSWPLDQVVKPAAIQLTILELVACQSLQSPRMGDYADPSLAPGAQPLSEPFHLSVERLCSTYCFSCCAPGCVAAAYASTRGMPSRTIILQCYVLWIKAVARVPPDAVAYQAKVICWELTLQLLAKPAHLQAISSTSGEQSFCRQLAQVIAGTRTSDECSRRSDASGWTRRGQATPLKSQFRGLQCACERADHQQFWRVQSGNFACCTADFALS